MNKNITQCTEKSSPWFTFNEAAKYLKLNPRTLRNYASKRMIKFHISITNTKRFHKKDLDEWMYGHK